MNTIRNLATRLALTATCLFALSGNARATEQEPAPAQPEVIFTSADIPMELLKATQALAPRGEGILPSKRCDEPGQVPAVGRPTNEWRGKRGEPGEAMTAQVERLKATCQALAPSDWGGTCILVPLGIEYAGVGFCVDASLLHATQGDLGEVETKARNAQTTADTARREARNAQTTADTARREARNAQTTANEAKRSGDTAGRLAVVAFNNADTARNEAAVAQALADKAHRRAVILTAVLVPIGVAAAAGLGFGIYAATRPAGQTTPPPTWVNTGAKALTGGITPVAGGVLMGVGGSF